MVAAEETWYNMQVCIVRRNIPGSSSGNLVQETTLDYWRLANVCEQGGWKAQVPNISPCGSPQRTTNSGTWSMRGLIHISFQASTHSLHYYPPTYAGYLFTLAPTLPNQHVGPGTFHSLSTPHIMPSKIPIVISKVWRYNTAPSTPP